MCLKGLAGELTERRSHFPASTSEAAPLADRRREFMLRESVTSANFALSLTLNFNQKLALFPFRLSRVPGMGSRRSRFQTFRFTGHGPLLQHRKAPASAAGVHLAAGAIWPDAVYGDLEIIRKPRDSAVPNWITYVLRANKFPVHV